MPEPLNQGLAQLWRAFVVGVALGFEEKLPAAVDIFVRGIAICALLSFGHFVLGIDLPGTAVLGLLGGGVSAAYVVGRSRAG